MKLGNTSKSLNALEIAIKNEPSYRTRAFEHDNFEQLKENPRFQEITMSKKLSANDFLELGDYFFQLHEWTMANHYYTAYLTSKSSNARILDLKGQCLFQMNYFREALSYFQRALNIEENPTFYNHIGMAFYKLEKFKKAAEFFYTYIEYDNETPIIYWNIALAEIKAGHKAASIKALKKAIKLDRGYLSMIKCHEAFKDIPENAFSN
jgi:tetratricopeptide (TPR) repeat protein